MDIPRTLGVNDYLLSIDIQSVKITDPSGTELLARFEANANGGVDYRIKRENVHESKFANGTTNSVAKHRFIGEFLGMPFCIIVRNSGGHLALSIETDALIRISAETLNSEILRVLRVISTTIEPLLNEPLLTRTNIYEFTRRALERNE